MATQAELISQLAALDRAIGSGVLEIYYQDRREKFQTTDDMLKARSALASQILTTPARTRQVRMFTDKGY